MCNPSLTALSTSMEPVEALSRVYSSEAYACFVRPVSVSLPPPENSAWPLMKKQALCVPPTASVSVVCVPSGSFTSMRLPQAMSMAAPRRFVRVRLFKVSVALYSPSMKKEPSAAEPASV